MFRPLRFSSETTHGKSTAKLRVGQQAFHIVGPELWNSPPRSPSDSPSDLSPSLRPKGKRTKFVTPKSTPLPSFPVKPRSYRGGTRYGNYKNSWSLPFLSKSIAVLGASNISRITQSPIKDIQLEAYHGASFYHFRQMLSKTRKSGSPSSIILGVGLNNRQTEPSKSSVREMTNVVNACFKKFPQSKIYLPKMNYSRSLPLVEQSNLARLNDCMDQLKKSHTNLVVIEQMNPSKFCTDSTDDSHIHWTAQTANDMLAFWLSHLN